MRDKVLAAIEIYAGGGTITRAIAEAGLKSVTPFYAALRREPEILELYETAIRIRSYVMLDEAYEISADNGLDAKKARAQAEIRLKVAAMSNPDRFGDRMNHKIEVKPSLSAAIEEGRKRAALPGRDLAQVEDAQLIDVTPAIPAGTADKQSAVPAIAGADDGLPDPFA